MADDGLFPCGAVIRQVDGEGVLLLGGGRALLMQLAHPAVAAGVAEHSGFGPDPFGRLQRTLEATYTMVFGTAQEAQRVAAAVGRVHERVQGDGYAANDPALLLWVHATLVDTALRVHERFLSPLSPDDAECYYQESKVLAELFGVPLDRQPPDLTAFHEYVRTMVSTLEVTDTARELARAVMHPRVPRLADPAFAFARQLTVGLLPLPLRVQYGFSWDRPRKLALLAAGAVSRRVLPLVPGSLRRAPSGLLT